ncbi:hypothetical protein UFOVP1290_177 [uncultured Caudovirales phage]|uniref:Uncharacterized protein n=1 Tax=uncultured Caudovirales phage TaxID=2100421 RepID=A0A6J5RQV3_9CAUD|nr:hypothetical protein UFOVP1290_177 [uncultured Caudovirales phage]
MSEKKTKNFHSAITSLKYAIARPSYADANALFDCKRYGRKSPFKICFPEHGIEVDVILTYRHSTIFSLPDNREYYFEMNDIYLVSEGGKIACKVYSDYGTRFWIDGPHWKFIEGVVIPEINKKHSDLLASRTAAAKKKLEDEQTKTAEDISVWANRYI